MQKMRIAFIIFLLSSVSVFSQKETWKWYISGKGALDFSSGSPVSFGNNAMNLSWEGCSTISDANGNLLFYTDGSWLYDKNHSVPPNGSNLNGCNSVTQVGIFVPKPGSATNYYLFIIGGPSFNGSSPPWTLYYNEINTTLNGGTGDISIKGVPLAASTANCGEKMTAVKHCNGVDYWLVVHDINGTAYRAYLVTAGGVSTTPVVSNVGTSFVTNANGDDGQGQMKLSPNGSKIASALYAQGLVEVCDFNKATGVVSNPLSLGNGGQYSYGVEFSPDNSKLYSSNVGTPASVRQWNLCAGSNAAILASGVAVGGNSNCSLQLGPDGKVYGNQFTATLSVINNPNAAGVGCNYSTNGVLLIPPMGSSLGLPNFISSYFDSPANSPQASVAPVNSGSCGCTGSATASICAVFGSSPYTYSWSNGTTTGPTTNVSSTVTNLCPGTYSVIVSDAACKSDTVAFSVSGTGNSFTVTPTSTPATCAGSNGSASVAVSGGTAPFTYLWNPSSQTTSAVTGLAGGNYTVTVTDGNNCTSTSLVNVAVTGGANVTVTPQNISCNGAGNGSATAAASGGTLPFTYSWSNGQTTSSATGLAVGNYSVMMTDASGCSGTQTFSITQPTVINATIFMTPTSCGQSTGQATILVSGGNSPYSYSWSNGQSSSIATALAAGTYSCTITDVGGCTHVASTTIINGNGPTASIASQTPTSCNGGNNGTASASASGGSAPYTFVWSNGQTAQTASGLSPTFYMVTVTDAGGCSNTQTVSITQPGAITASTSNTQAGCGLTNGTATANANGGTGAFTYGWSNGQASQTATGLAAGNYSVTITDANGCTQTATTNISNSNGPTANVGADVTIQSGSSTQLLAGGGTNYSWSPAVGLNNSAVSNPTASPTITTTYCVLVTDAGGCSDSACVTVYVTPEPVPCGEFYLPNAFSPNEDNENDVFKAYVNPDCVKEFKLIIYNRWGEKVFETENVLKSWDGMFRGILSDPAVYAWYCRAVLTNGNKINREGNVSLVR